MSSSFKDHFSGLANRYADCRPRYPAALFDFLATLVPRNAVVWDCACGSGQATLDLAERFERVIGTDASGEQIASAKPHPAVEYRVAMAENSGAGEDSISLVTVAQAVHWFDLDRFYAEVSRVLVPDGVIAIWCYGINTVEGGEVNEIVQGFYADTVGAYWPPERALVEAGYRTIPFPFLELDPPVFRMEAQWTPAQLLGYYATWSATNRYINATGTDPLKPLAKQLEKTWGHSSVARRVIWPLSVRVGRLCK